MSEKPADEDEVAAREWWSGVFGRAYTESARIAMLARFRATAREQGRQAAAEEMRETCAAFCDRHPWQADLGDVLRALPLPEPSR